MSETNASDRILETSAGDFDLEEFRLNRDGREWKILHTGAVLSRNDESRVVETKGLRLPYGVALWPSAIALAQEIAGRGIDFSGRRILELGAGTGIPGIVAATLGARVLQTDRDELALQLCRRNGARNRISTVDYQLADWTKWDNLDRYDWIIGADILYAETLHDRIRAIFDANLVPGGRILISDPLRSMSIRLLETLEGEGWAVRFNKWQVGEETPPRPVGVFELIPPGPPVL